MIKIISLVCFLSSSAAIFAAESEEACFWGAIEEEDYDAAREILEGMPAPIKFDPVKVEKFSKGVEVIKQSIPRLWVKAVEAPSERRSWMDGLEAYFALVYEKYVEVYTLMKEKEGPI